MLGGPKTHTLETKASASQIQCSHLKLSPWLFVSVLTQEKVSGVEVHRKAFPLITSNVLMSSPRTCQGTSINTFVEYNAVLNRWFKSFQCIAHQHLPLLYSRWLWLVVTGWITCVSLWCSTIMIVVWIKHCVFECEGLFWPVCYCKFANIQSTWGWYLFTCRPLSKSHMIYADEGLRPMGWNLSPKLIKYLPTCSSDIYILVKTIVEISQFGNTILTNCFCCLCGHTTNWAFWFDVVRDSTLKFELN